MNIKSKDLNLLYLFQVLYEERNLSRAASRIALSQPALSHKLNKLRNEFDDPLFVRAARGLTPTPEAHRLAPEVRRLVGDVERFYQTIDTEDFLHNQDAIHIYATDLVEQLMLPKLLPIVSRSAPNLQIITHNTRGALPREELETGQCDLAIAGFFTDLPDSFYQQRVCVEEFVVLASRNNTRIQNDMDLEDFLRCEHVVTTLTGDLQGLVDRALAEQNLKRKVVAGISSFSIPPLVVAQSDFIVTCLRPIAELACQQQPELQIFDCPLELAPVQIGQIWHQRTHNDPMRRWARSQIFDVMSERQR